MKDDVAIIKMREDQRLVHLVKGFERKKIVQVFDYTNIFIGLFNFFSNMFGKKKSRLQSETKMFLFRNTLDWGTIEV